MSYAVRNDNQGWRAVASEQDVMEGEYFSLVQPDLTPKITARSVKEAITQKRWGVETGGIALPTGVRVATGIDDQNRITSVVANAERAGVAEVDFKAGSGWVRVTVAELQAIAAAVALHVQACFSAERAHHEAIDALVVQYEGDAEGLQAALGAYDIESGWPSVNPQQA